MIETKIVNNLTKEEETITSKTEYLPLPPLEGHVAYVGADFGFTEPLGNFRSARGKVSLFYPCDPAKVSDVYPKVKAWVDKRLGSELAEIQAYLDSKKSVDAEI